MAAFVGFDPVKSHKPEIVRFASFCVAVVGACVLAVTRRGI